MNEHLQTVGIFFFFQNGIGTASYNDTAFFLRNLPNNIGLDNPQLILIAHTIGITGYKCIGQPAARNSIFTAFFDIIMAKSALFCHLDNKLLVIAFNAKLFCYISSDGSSAASELTTDRNNSVCHNDPSYAVFVSVQYLHRYDFFFSIAYFVSFFM